MSRRERKYTQGEVYVYEGKPILIWGENASSSFKCYYLHSDGSLGNSKDLSIWQLEKAEPLDFAKMIIHVDLPQEWQQRLMTNEEGRPKSSSDEGEMEYHPSYGAAQVTRTSGSKVLFGSPFRHQHFITLRINRAYQKRSLHETLHYSTGTLLTEIQFSESQWAHFMASMSLGLGVPCTINYVGHQKMENCPTPDEHALFEQELREKVEGVAVALQKFRTYLEEVLEKKSLTKADKAEILNRVGGMTQAVTANLPFILNQYKERMEKVTDAARTEIESFFTNTMMRLGLQKFLGAGSSPIKMLQPGQPEDES